ncbi:TonB-dependent receptor [Gracilimonas sp.]|uniref:TonB-dependent receptor domain-containing protein n=1 Tax=Gracilimonas sp. TaxID=1974203 RepID=UPI0032ED7D2B
MIRKLLFLVLALFWTTTAYAQSGSITGTIVDAVTGEELPGANIYISELGRGASSDVNGGFTISDIPYGTYNVRVTYIGYLRQDLTINVDGSETLDISLEEDIAGLEEIVVTGQGQAIDKKRLSTTVDVISAKDLESIPAIRLDQVLQANLPNSQIRLSSGQPGTASLIRGRGVNSALTSSTPVIYIDGVRVDNTTGANQSIATGGAESSSVADIPLENIERIEFIKGGAATTLYGADAANGVIQIFTKKGVRGASNFTFESNLGITKGTEDFLFFDRTADILFETGVVQEYKMSASGGSEDITYSFGGSMLDNDGFRKNNEEIRHSLRTTVSANVNDIVKYTGSIGFTSSEYDRDRNANSSAGSFNSLEGARFGNVDELSQEDYTALDEMITDIQDNVDLTEDNKRFQTSHNFDFDIRQGLTAKATVGLDNRTTRQREIQTNAYLIALGVVPPGTADQGSIELFERDYLGITLEGNIQYQKDFEDISTITLLGGQFFRTDDRQVNILGSEIPDGVKTMNAASETSVLDFRRTLANYGFFFQENIGFKDKYFIEFGARIDDNTAFGELVDPQLFPKVGVSYSLSSESFFQNLVPQNAISNVKIRANYGEAGNFPTPFSNQVLADIDPFRGSQSIEFGTAGDPNLKPERSKTYEAGLDLGFWNNRATLEFTYYSTVTEDALFNSNNAPSTGLGASLQNVGEIENKGWELSSRIQVLQSRDYSLSFRASANSFTNKVLASGGAPFQIGGFAFLGAWVEEGKPIGYFRGNNPVFDGAGNLVEVIPNDDLGSSIPDLFGSFGMNFNYKSLAFNVSGDYQLGGEVVNTTEVLKFLRGAPDDRYPVGAQGVSFNELAGLWVEDATYTKIRLISLDYTLPQEWYSGIVRNISIGAMALNPFNFVANNIDPEVTGANVGTQGTTEVGTGGFVYGTESQPRQFLGSIKIDF